MLDKPHAAVVASTVQRRKGFNRLMSSQECQRLQYGRKSKHQSVINVTGQKSISVAGQKSKLVCDNDFFVAPGKTENLLLIMS